MELITRQTVADKLSGYLRHELSLMDLVGWAESALMEREFDPSDSETIRDVVARLGLSDVRAFGLTWEECEEFLSRLGYSARVSIVAK